MQRITSVSSRGLSRSWQRHLPCRSLSTSNSTATAPATYVRALPSGQLPAYDIALAYLEADKVAKLERLRQLTEAGKSEKSELDELEINAWVNDPETRYHAKLNQGDLSKPIYRHLAERAFRKDGPLALLLQRIHQMSLVPDLLAEIHPIVDMRITIDGNDIEAGQYLLPTQTKKEVQITAYVFHPEERLYTLLMIDPDVPDPSSQSFTTYAHWIVPNISLSSTHSTVATDSPSLSYIPPHPQAGTPYHRYSFLLFAQADNQPIEINMTEDERDSLNVRDFAEQYRLQAEGVNFFRQVWDRSVTSIYKDVLKIDEPKYGRAPKFNSYVDQDGKRPPKYSLQ